MTDELITLGAAALARRIRAGEVSVSAVVDAHIARIEAVNPAINALVTPLFDSAREQARAADARIAETGTDDLPPLFGVPVTVKDAFPVAGARFTAGSWFLRDNIASQDAAAVQRLREAGAIILGKTNCPDMSWVVETDNLVFGLTRNPWNLNHSAGGSSGGEGALIAAGGSPLGLGSDIGGSIRLPAAMNGTVGLKPSAGRIPTEGHIPGDPPPAIAGWNTAGPLARRVEDLALALDVLSETPTRDFHALDLAGRHAVAYVHNGLIPVHREVADAVNRAAGALQALGMHTTRRDDLPFVQLALAWMAQLEAAIDVRTQLGAGERLSLWQEFLANRRGAGRVSNKALYSVLQIDAGRLTRALGFGSPWRVDLWRERLLAAMGPGGVLVMPVFFTPAQTHGAAYRINGNPAYTMTLNMLGFPAVSVPVGFARGGLPLNVQVVAAPGEDETALAVAAGLEQVFGGWQLATPPPLPS